MTARYQLMFETVFLLLGDSLINIAKVHAFRPDPTGRAMVYFIGVPSPMPLTCSFDDVVGQMSKMRESMQQAPKGQGN